MYDDGEDTLVLKCCRLGNMRDGIGECCRLVAVFPTLHIALYFDDDHP